MGNLKKSYTTSRKLISDSRGWFLKVIDGNETENPFPCEVYFTSAKPGESKGGHYHAIANEWFTLVEGEAILKLMDMETREEISIRLTGEKPETVFVPAGVAHLIVNNGTQNYLLVAYTSRKYEPSDTIPFEF